MGQWVRGSKLPSYCETVLRAGLQWRRKYMRVFRGARVAAGAWATMAEAE